MSGRIMSIAEAAEFANEARKMGKIVVTTNGSFDLLHEGHKHVLAESRKQGDVLIVGVNSDSSVKGYKGPDRPIEPEAVRAKKVAEYADAVFIFNGPNPLEWIYDIAPNVHVNAASYGEDCIESSALKEMGAKLVLVPVQKELGSTTQIIERMRAEGTL